MKIGFIKDKPVPGPPAATGIVDGLEPPDKIPEPQPTRIPIWVWPLIIVLAVVWLVVDIYRTTGSSSTMFSMNRLLIGAMIFAGMAGMYRGGRGGATGRKSGREIEADRRKYLRRLDEKREELHDAARQQYDEILWHHPHPADLTARVGTPRMWERRPATEAGAVSNFGDVRIGTAITRRTKTLEPPAQIPPAEEIEPLSGMVLREFLRAQPLVHGVPKPVAFRDNPGLAFFGDRDRARSLVRAMICQLAAAHDAKAVQVIVVATDVAPWEWVMYLPHAQHPVQDLQGQRRAVYRTLSEFRAAWPGIEKQESHKVKAQAPSHLTLVVNDTTDGMSWAGVYGAQGRMETTFIDLTGDANTVFAQMERAYFYIEADGVLLHPVRSADGKHEAKGSGK
ncbi:hypothetical protein [Tsukamurella ocularis]|uniref:hypothetical protein n=1 Tax=Tsukamurella ocularis TaxID=1970234 RepID=UPI0021696E8D|nr:hypothetical protein [Tsukamurella ocularis]MCS3853318.1 DNA segregation ATPase FtsK/SpoIIIE-like protein [Tsukamurella ocularis]